MVFGCVFGSFGVVLWVLLVGFVRWLWFVANALIVVAVCCWWVSWLGGGVCFRVSVLLWFVVDCG